MININLLPQNLRSKRESGLWRILYFAVPVLVAIIIGLFTLSIRATQRSLKADKAQLEQRLVELEPYVRKQEELTARQEELQELVNVAQSLEVEDLKWSEQIFELLKTVPPKGSKSEPTIVFTNFSLSKADSPVGGTSVDLKADMSGRARDSNALLTYLRILESDSRYSYEFKGAQKVDGSPLAGGVSETLFIDAPVNAELLNEERLVDYVPNAFDFDIIIGTFILDLQESTDEIIDGSNDGDLGGIGDTGTTGTTGTYGDSYGADDGSN